MTGPALSPQVLVTLTVPPSIEEILVDWLLQFAEHTGFSSQKANGHSGRMEGLSLAEQVAGRKNQTRFQLHLPAEGLPHFLDALKRDFAGADLHYWVAPLLEAGHL
jgi:hypothetical protein